MTADNGLDDDDVLETLLRNAADDDLSTIPAEVDRFARQAFQWATIEGELAQLVEVDGAAMALRGGDDDRLLTFEAGDSGVSLEVAAGQLVGSLHPAERSTVVVTTPSGEQTIETDAMGRFRAAAVPPFRLVVRSATGRFTTPWVIT